MSDSLPMWGVEEPDRSPATSVGRDRLTYVAAGHTMQLPAVDGAPTDIAGVWAPSAHVAETGTPVHRALATVIRAAPIMVLMAILGVPAAWLVGWDWMLAVAIVAGFTLVGFMGVLWVDLSWNSPGSTEAKRISAAFRLKRMELKNSHELRRAIVEAYIERMNGDGHA